MNSLSSLSHEESFLHKLCSYMSFCTK
uniref:Uncharacterized protein n=1 Tax=Rhizophora mucronata TaxID=61149 RepID=A0A2P2N9D8_RHIMU